jgi:rhodanese-related sulfurtransferase
MNARFAESGLQLYSKAALLANWDGTAVVISRGAANDGFLRGAKLDCVLGATILSTVVYLVQRIFFYRFRHLVADGRGSSLRYIKRQTSEAAVIIALSLALAIGWHAVSPIGFLNNPTALADIACRYYSADFPILTLAQTVEEIKNGDPLVLDARSASDYRHGSIPGAKSMSIYASLPERQTLLLGVQKSRRIIVYCQSTNCHYADQIALFLKFNGYENLAIYRQGYQEWSVHFGESIPVAQKTRGR